ncbi:hypothetical protein Agub_g4897 [Astrephomene gubernaculifera]|uniref:RING-type E3 ubiquitin transferase n=1 Tax=Astrephomene gubernaculifera TaxID=47775 RepID=A0AAD3DL01_9CHLO|nr:hypothetical protein Agub_g4897 [Astrephomene gubernaculifera]
MQHDDVCLVCADPLEFTAFGSCGHKEVCSRCVARMRFVLKDKGCVFCRQENAQVYFTRFMGDFTARLAPEDFDGLQARANRRELFAMPEINGFFDDEKHYQEISALCGFTHPVLEAGSGKGAPKFNNFKAMKRHIETTLNQFFCDVCVTGRKVFVSEQLLYTRDGLRRHQDAGDESGPLAESGFKGHPPCKFCRTRFYDSNELYRHMEGSHEHCFLCRRNAPDKYVYYRHYKELEDHFTKDHFPCPHPECLERKFVVFSTDYELKAHFAAEHGDQLKMSAAQRRQALTIPMQLQYRSRDDEETEPGPSARFERAAVVIGGGHNISSRAARSGRAGGRGGMHHSRSEPQFAPSLGQDAGGEVSSVTFTAEDFPAPSSAQQGGAGPLGRWAAFAGAQGSTGNLSDQDFPALPTLSKNQRRRIKEQQRSLADRLAAAAQPPRVLNRAAAGPSGASGSGGAGPSTSGTADSSQAVPGLADFPSLSAAAPAASSMPSTSAPAPAAVSRAPAFVASSSSARATEVLAPASSSRRPPGFGKEEFPALGGGGKSRPPPPPQSPSPAASPYAGVTTGQQPAPVGPLSQADVLQSLFMRPGSAAVTLAPAAASTSGSGAAARPESPLDLKADDFPSLPGGSRPAGRARAAALKTQVAKGQAAKPSPEKPAAAGGATGGGGGGVSESLKAANKALIERIKRQLSGAAFDTFRQQSQKFMRGELSADEYHDYMVSLGLLSLVAELVSLCPDAAKRRLLLDVHRGFIASPAAQDPGLVGAGWMPPEAAVAKADRVAEHSSWSCARCSLCNAPDDARCESCKGPRPTEKEQQAAARPLASAPEPVPLSMGFFFGQPAPMPQVASTSGQARASNHAPPPPPAADDFPALGGGGRAASMAVAQGPSNLSRADSFEVSDPDPPLSAGSGGKGKKGKGTTIKIGLPASGGSGSSRPHPQNAWTQPQRKANVASSWAGQGGNKLAKMHGAINDAWD